MIHAGRQFTGSAEGRDRPSPLQVTSSFNSGIELWRKGGAPNAAVAGCKPALGTTTIW